MATMTHEEVEEKMLDMLEEVCGDEEVRDHRDEDLFELGFLDSMAAVELLVDIEDEFDVSIAPTEVEREEMNTVNLIIEQVEKRLEGLRKRRRKGGAFWLEWHLKRRFRACFFLRALWPVLSQSPLWWAAFAVRVRARAMWPTKRASTITSIRVRNRKASTSRRRT